MDVHKIQAALTHLKNGGLIIMTDDEDREAEGDLLGIASQVTPATVNFMTKHARGLLCAPVSEAIAKQLCLDLMVQDNTEPYHTAFTVSLDHKSTSTGISAYDRAATIKAMADPTSTHDDFYYPGHIFPLIAKENGVLARNGHTEAAVDLAELAGEPGAGYICEILDADGHMARRSVLEKMAEELRLPILTVKELQEYRRLVVSQPVPPVHLPSAYGDFTLRHFDDGNLALIKGDPTTTTPLVRVHSECFTGDVLGSLRCDCGPQLHAAMEAIDQAGTGILIYLRQEGRGIGLPNKLRAYRLQEEGFDTVEANHQLGFAADERTYEAASYILRALHVLTIKLLTNNPDKISQLEEAGITVAARVPLEMPATAYDRAYLKTKQEKMHHLLKLTEEEQHA